MNILRVLNKVWVNWAYKNLYYFNGMYRIFHFSTVCTEYVWILHISTVCTEYMSTEYLKKHQIFFKTFWFFMLRVWFSCVSYTWRRRSMFFECSMLTRNSLSYTCCEKTPGRLVKMSSTVISFLSKEG